MNTKMTVEVIDAAAKRFEEASKLLSYEARQLEKDGDFERASDCVNIITNTFANLRMDLLVIRPLREYERSRWT